MTTTTVTKKEIRKSLDYSKIRKNIIIYAIIYSLCIAAGVLVLLYVNPTTGAIITAIAVAMTLYIIIYQLIRLIGLVNGHKTMPCYIVKLDRVVWYMNNKFPVFAVSVPTAAGARYIETNVIYTKEQVPVMKGHKAKILYDAKKDRIYIINLVD